MKSKFIGPLLVLTLACLGSNAQEVTLQNSGNMLKKASEHYRADRLGAAEQLVESIYPGDTNYITAQLYAAEIAFNQKEYQKAKDHCLLGLMQPSGIRNQLYNILLLSYHHLGINDSSDYYSQLGMKEFPFDHLIAYNRGLVLDARGKWSEALSSYFKCVNLNPLFSMAHFRAGYLAIRANRQSQALMAWGFYLMINNSDRDMSNDIENVAALRLELNDDDIIFDLGVPNALAAVDRRITAGEALNKGFKTGVKLDFKLVNQYKLLIDALDQITDANDPFIKHYLKFYKEIKQEKLFEPLVRSIVKPLKIDKNSTWLTKNEKAVGAVFQIAGRQASAMMDRQTFTFDGKSYDLECWYERFKIQSLGEVDSGKAELKKGTWFYLNSNKAIESVGNYSNYKKNGWWKYYNEEGWLNAELHYVDDLLDGERIRFDISGNVIERMQFKQGKVVDTAFYYYACGQLKMVSATRNELKHGLEREYYPNGVLFGLSYYKEGNMVDTVRRWHETGLLFQQYQLDEESKRHGAFLEWNEEGKLVVKGQFIRDQRHGIWQGFYPNGKLQYEGMYNDSGLAEGPWKYFEENGQTERLLEFKNGRYEGVLEYFKEGRLQARYKVVDMGKFIEATYFDEKGREIGKFGDPNGNFSLQSYGIDGVKVSEGQYKNGFMDGEWKFFDKYGNLVRRALFKEGMLQGKEVHYDALGNIRIETNYVDNEQQGYFRQLYVDGTLSAQGYHQAGKQIGRWEFYHENGKIREAAFFDEGTKTGPVYHYAAKGNVKRLEIWDQSAVRSERYYDLDGKVYHANNYPGGNGIEIWPFTQGRIRFKTTVRCDSKIDSAISYHINGAVAIRSFYVNGEKEGKEQSYFDNGRLEAELTNLNGVPHGMYKEYYKNGKVRKTGRYQKGNQVGEWKWYFENGTLEMLERFNDEGYLSGWTQFYDQLGQLAFERLWEDNELKALRYLLPSGEYTPPIALNRDTITIVTYFRNGKVSSIHRFKAGLRHNELVQYHSDGSLLSRSNYVLGVLHGPFELGDPAQVIRLRGKYLNDDWDGVRSIYDQKGKLEREETYYAGWKEGLVTYYQPNGQVAKKEIWWQHEGLPTNE